jgi:2-polyprenyl-3-methyl-5-hydroxy-6-metoxy-1,4-benzoquinol methylase
MRAVRVRRRRTVFGERMDYLLLRSMAHDENRATEEELNREGSSSLMAGQEETKLEKVLERFEGQFPMRPGLRYLDMGCGSGELTLELARILGGNVTGVDFLPRFVDRARARAAAEGLEDAAHFVCADLHAWEPPHPFDVVFSFDALEHIANPRAFMARMGDFLAPDGVAIVSFGPLFHSPFGDHMSGFFRRQLPWRGVLFSEPALMRVRREFYRPTDPARRYQEVAGGLNLMRYSEFLEHARAAGWRFRYLRTNAFLRNPALRGINRTVCSLPVVRDYFIHNVYAVMERAAMPLQRKEPKPADERLAA